MRTPAKITAAASAAALALAACGGSRPAAHHARAAAAATTPAAHLTAAQETQECAALDLVRMGNDTYAAQVQAVAGQYATSQHAAQVIIAMAIRDQCPSLISVIPASAPQP